MPEDDPDFEKVRKAAEELGIEPDLVIAIRGLTPKARAAFLSKAKPRLAPKKRGRRKGSGGDYSAALQKMADLIIGTPELSITRAASQVSAEWGAAKRGHVSASRLRHLYGEQRKALEAEARQRNKGVISRRISTGRALSESQQGVLADVAARAAATAASFRESVDRILESTAKEALLLSGEPPWHKALLLTVKEAQAQHSALRDAIGLASPDTRRVLGLLPVKDEDKDE